MSWITLTTDEVVEEFNERELTALNALKGREALGGILARVVARVRGAVYAGGTVLGEDGTIPDSLALDAVALTRWRFLISVAKNEGLQTEGRKAAAEAAEERLVRVEKGELKVESGSGTAAETGLAGPSFEVKQRDFDRADEDGL